MRSAPRTAVVCGVDIGSTNSKVVAVDRDGTVVGRASRPTPRHPEGLSIDVLALAVGIEEMIVEVCGSRFAVHAICAAGVGEDGILVDSRLEALTQPLAWFDPRRQRIFRRLQPDLHDDDRFDAASDPVRSFVGWRWSRMQLIPREPASWIAIADLVAVGWSGRTFLSDTLASRTGAWRSVDRAWAEDRVELTLGSLDLLPPVVATGEIVGGLRSTTLEAAGVLAPDAITVAGGHDHPIGGWGVEQLSTGAVLDSMGTAEVVVAQSPRAGLVRRDQVDVAPGIRTEGTTLLRVEELARNVAWASQNPEVAECIRDLLDGSIDPIRDLDPGAFIPGRSGGQPAYATDAPSDPLARASAVLWAMARVGGEAVDAVRAGVGSPSEVYLAGGWSRSPGWVEIKAAVNGFPTVPIREPEVTAVGAALLAASALGWQPDQRRALGRIETV